MTLGDDTYFYSTKPDELEERQTGELLYRESCFANDVYPVDWNIRNSFGENHEIKVSEVFFDQGGPLDRSEAEIAFFSSLRFDAINFADFTIGYSNLLERDLDDYHRGRSDITAIKQEYEFFVVPAGQKQFGKYYAGSGLRFRVDTGDIGIYEALLKYDRDKDLSQPVFFYENDYTRLLYQQYIPAVDKLLGPFRDVNQDTEVTPPGDNYVDQIAGFLTGDFDYWYTLSKDVDFSEDTGNVVDVDWKFNNSVVKTQIVDEGASVKANDPILIIRTGEVDRSVVSPVNGRVNFSVSENDSVNDGSLLARITEQVLREYPKGSYFLVSGSGNSEGPFDSPDFKMQFPNEWEIEDSVKLTFGVNDQLDPTNYSHADNFTEGESELPDEDYINNPDNEKDYSIKYNSNKTSYTLSFLESPSDYLSVVGLSWGIATCDEFVDLPSSRKLDDPEPPETYTTDLIVPVIDVLGWKHLVAESVPGGNTTNILMNYFEFDQAIQGNGLYKPSLQSEGGIYINYAPPVGNESQKGIYLESFVVDSIIGPWTSPGSYSRETYSFEICVPSCPDPPDPFVSCGDPVKVRPNHSCRDITDEVYRCASGGDSFSCNPCRTEDEINFSNIGRFPPCTSIEEFYNPCVSPDGSIMVSPGQCADISNVYGSLQMTGGNFDHVYSLADQSNADGAVQSCYGGISRIPGPVILGTHYLPPKRDPSKPKRIQYGNFVYRKIISKIKGVDSFDIRYELFGGTVKEIKVKKGDIVTIGTVLMTIEVGSTTREIVSPREGTIDNIAVDVGSSLSRNDVLASIFLSSELIFSPCEISVKEGEKFGTLAGDWKKQTGDPRRQDVNIYYRNLPEIDFDHTNLVGPKGGLSEDEDRATDSLPLAEVPSRVKMTAATGLKQYKLTSSQKRELERAMDQVPMVRHDKEGMPLPHKMNACGSKIRTFQETPDGIEVVEIPLCPGDDMIFDFYEYTYGISEDFDEKMGEVYNLIDEFGIMNLPDPGDYRKQSGMGGVVGEGVGCDPNSPYNADPLNGNDCTEYFKDLGDFKAFALDLVTKHRMGRNGHCVSDFIAPYERDIASKGEVDTNNDGVIDELDGSTRINGLFYGKVDTNVDGVCGFEYKEMPLPDPDRFEGDLNTSSWDYNNAEQCAGLSKDFIYKQFGIGLMNDGSYDNVGLYYEVDDIFPITDSTKSYTFSLDNCLHPNSDPNNDGTINQQDTISLDSGVGSSTVDLEIPLLNIEVTYNIVSLKDYAFTIGDEADIQEEEDD